MTTNDGGKNLKVPKLSGLQLRNIHREFQGNRPINHYNIHVCNMVRDKRWEQKLNELFTTSDKHSTFVNYLSTLEVKTVNSEKTVAESDVRTFQCLFYLFFLAHWSFSALGLKLLLRSWWAELGGFGVVIQRFVSRLHQSHVWYIQLNFISLNTQKPTLV